MMGEDSGNLKETIDFLHRIKKKFEYFHSKNFSLLHASLISELFSSNSTEFLI